MSTLGEQRVKALLSASAFLCAPQTCGHVSARTLFDVVHARATLQQQTLCARFHDRTGDGCLLEAELRAYLCELAPTLLGIGMPATFTPQWSRFAARRFLFFIDLRRSGTVRIRDLLASPLMQELLALGTCTADADPGYVENRFAPRSVLALYKHFLELDEDKSGTLSAAEFAKYAGAGGGGFTPLFVARVFEQHVQSRRRREMDLHGFADFVSAWTHKQVRRRGMGLPHTPRGLSNACTQHPVSLSYFFRVLDVHAQRCLTSHEVRTWSRAVVVADCCSTPSDPPVFPGSARHVA